MQLLSVEHDTNASLTSLIWHLIRFTTNACTLEKFFDYGFLPSYIAVWSGVFHLVRSCLDGRKSVDPHG
jgi:hypothetical protein